MHRAVSPPEALSARAALDTCPLPLEGHGDLSYRAGAASVGDHQPGPSPP